MKEKLDELSVERKQKSLVPEKRYQFTNQMQTQLVGPNNSRIPYAMASKAFDVMQRLEREQQTWAAAVYALQLLYEGISNEEAYYAIQ